MNTKALVIEDDVNIADLLRLYLEKEGFEVAIAGDGRSGLDKFEQFQPSVVLLDIMLPVMDGWQVLSEIRKTSKTPVIMLTAKGTEYEKVRGLDLGADDYIPKPFGMMELISRVRALLRRAGDTREQTDEYRAGGLVVNTSKHTVTVNGKPVSLSLKEFEVLRLLLENRGKVLTRSSLLDAIWGYEFDGETRTVDVHMRNLRKKLGPCGSIIGTVRGVGYKID